MPKVKTSPDKQENTAIFQLITDVNHCSVILNKTE